MIKAVAALLRGRRAPLHVELYLPARQRFTVVVGANRDRPSGGR